MTFAEITRSHMTSLDEIIEIGEGKILEIEFEDTTFNSPHISCKPHPNASETTKLLLKKLKTSSYEMTLEVYLQSRIYTQGPKVFRPTAEQMFALERMNLNLTVADFNTPFETICVELPKAYVESRGLPEANVAQLHFQKNNRFFIHNIMYEKHVMKTWWRPDNENMMEEWLSEDYSNEMKFTDVPVEDRERIAEIMIRRAILNYCLLLDEVGIKSDGPAVPNQFNQLVKWCQKSNKHTKKNKGELQAQPILYSLKPKPIQLMRVVSNQSELGSSTDKIMSPHSRRGHYRMQPHGPNNTLRKRIRILPCIVNSHLLMGPPPTQIYVT